ncbi:MAG: hypothetical protein IKH69_00200 [Bacteroidaceae bacterium]|nr:hypothetical protein [Bacteroidaceae bacterium]
MKYKVREGIVLIHVCGEHLLVASRAAWPEVKMIRHLPRIPALCWDLLSRGADEKTIAIFVVSLLKRPLAEVKIKLDALWEEMYNAGYLIKVEEVGGDE